MGLRSKDEYDPDDDGSLGTMHVNDDDRAMSAGYADRERRLLLDVAAAARALVDYGPEDGRWNALRNALVKLV